MLSRRHLIATGLSLAFLSQARGAESMPITLQGAGLLRKALKDGVAVDQVIPNDAVPYPLLTFDQAIVDTMNAFNAANSSFVIPAGIAFAEFRAQVVWYNNPVGLRQLVILRKSPANVDPNKWEFFPASPVATQQASVGTTTDMETGTVSLTPVQPGEEFAVFPLQMSGGDLTISGGTGTVFGAKFYSA
jgi:hypothetical protein